MARLARGNSLLMFVYIILLGAVVSAFFTNDGGILIMTPIVLAMVRALQFDGKMVLPFVMAVGFIADTSSLPLVVSNLVNIISADFFDIGFAEYASRMIVPNFFSIAASLLVLYLFYRKSIPGGYDPGQLKQPAEAIKDWRLFKLSWAILAAMLAAFFAGELLSIPVSLIIGVAAAAFLAAARKSPAVQVWKLVKGAPWNIIIFSIGMYVVVYGLQNAGLTAALGSAIEWVAGHGLYAASVGMGLIAAILSSIMNNLPTVMIDALAIQTTQTEGIIRDALVYANVIGSDLGPKMTPIGSLATLLWLHVLSSKQVKIGWGYYLKAGVVLTIPTLLIALSGLAIWLSVLESGRVNAWLGIASAAVLFAASAFAVNRLIRFRAKPASGRKLDL